MNQKYFIVPESQEELKTQCICKRDNRMHPETTPSGQFVCTSKGIKKTVDCNILNKKRNS
jgi:hypothetical protein